MKDWIRTKVIKWLHIYDWRDCAMKHEADAYKWRCHAHEYRKQFEDVLKDANAVTAQLK